MQGNVLMRAVPVGGIMTVHGEYPSFELKGKVHEGYRGHLGYGGH
jgi:hypothetical protein